MLLAKLSLFEPIDIDELRERGPANADEALRLELHAAHQRARHRRARAGRAEHGARRQGGDGAVPCRDDPGRARAQLRGRRAACDSASTARARQRSSRHRRSCGTASPIASTRPTPSESTSTGSTARRWRTWRIGQTLLLSGRVLTARDAAHKRLVDLLERGQPLPVDLAGPRRLLRRPGRRGGRRGGRAGRPDDGHAHGQVRRAAAGADRPAGDDRQGRTRAARRWQSIRRHGAAYLAATGGAAYLLSKAIRSARVSRSRTSAWRRSTSSS